MGIKDYLLIIVLYGSLILGVFFPKMSGQVSPFIKYLMMCMLFLSFIKISPGDVWVALRSNPVSMALGTAFRLLMAPALAFYITQMVYPPLALPILLLAGVSTGVSSPFFTSLCNGNISFCLVMAVLTNLLVPFSLPFMVKVLAQSTLDYDLYSMALFLAMIILIPLAAAFALRYLFPGILGRVNRLSYPISLMVIAAINFGALGRYVPYLTANPLQIIYCAIFATGLAVIMAGLGWMVAGNVEWPDKVASSGSQVWLNNVLIIALAVHLDKPLAAALGVFYFLPLYGFVVIFSMMASRRSITA
jgi:bile acid:Na+ symporter, BASS family